ncbi:MAG: metal-dependent transcriptional regulator [Chloroflexi bacterium]|nr:metal-dependent transcriptional regulator [Chloroflexota bacterium]
MKKISTTPTIEEYLEAIYIMTSESAPVISARLAERQGVTAPTMTDTLKRLIKAGYVSLNDRKEISLTALGLSVAEALVRRHRLSERWLTDVLGLDWCKAHEEACKLEHAISAEVEERLSRALDHPSTCPHGNPIPGIGPAVSESSICLEHVAVGAKVVIERVSEAGEEDPRLLEYLQRHGLKPGVALTVAEVAPWAGTITLRNAEQTVTLGLQAAGHIWVQPVGI